MEATWNGALFSAATIRLPVSTQSSRRAFGKAVVQRRVQRQFLSCDFMEYFAQQNHKAAT
jgi:hypothetical protein